MTTMNFLILMAMLLLIPDPQNQKLPDEFYQIPEQVRTEASLIVTGTYAMGRGPCIFMPDGTRIWARESWFRVTKVYRGEVGGRVGGKFIYFKSAMLPKTKDVSEELEVGHNYLVLLRPSAKS